MTHQPRIIIIGAGPAGLFAAERLAQAGCAVEIADQMPSPGRKFLMAGRGGLNLTHSEPLPEFLKRYPEAPEALLAAISRFPPQELRRWADDLKAQTFVGSSGRVFPKAMKASPLLREWLRRLEALSVRFLLRWQLTGLEPGGKAVFQTPEGMQERQADAILLCCGGASWPRLGSTGAWTKPLIEHGIAVEPFAPSNAGLLIDWSTHMAPVIGAPLKRIRLALGGQVSQGEVVLSRNGLEGGAAYALSHAVRKELMGKTQAEIRVDLKPDSSDADLAAKLGAARRGETQTHALKRLVHLSATALAVLREGGPLPREPGALAARLKSTPLMVHGLGGLERSISSAGGLPLSELDRDFMLNRLPRVFAAGEMLDWDAPTGGYLLQACFSTAFAASEGIKRHLGLAPP